MAVDLTIRTPPIKQFQAVLREAERTGYKSARNGVKWGAILFAQSAAKRTKRSKKKRRIVANPTYMTLRERRKALKAGQILPKGHMARRAIEAYGQRVGRYLMPINERRYKKDRQIIENRGLSKGSWGWMLAKMNKPKGMDASMNATGREVVDVQTQLHSENPTIRMRNELGWITKANPGIIPASLHAAAATMLKRIQNNFRKAGF